MGEAGLRVRVDTAGNIIGRREGRDSTLPAIMFGSHIDSVPGGGNYEETWASSARSRWHSCSTTTRCRLDIRSRS